jgi:hypothetical protein
VIDALNRDMPFDQFLLDQIAGDWLPNGTVEPKVATGFQRNAVTNREDGIDVEQYRNEKLIDRTATFGTAYLGLTIECAQCHDHKYDPLTQRGSTSGSLSSLIAEEVDVELQPAWESRMKDARAHPGEWADWDKAHGISSTIPSG